MSRRALVAAVAAALAGCPAPAPADDDDDPAPVPVTDASVVDALCRRFEACSDLRFGDCEVAFRNVLVETRNHHTEVCDGAADSLRGGLACATEQSCDVVAAGPGGWTEVCPQLAVAFDLLDVCEGNVPDDDVDEGPELPCAAAKPFGDPNPEATPITLDGVEGFFDAAGADVCLADFGVTTSATLILRITGDPGLVVNGMAGFDGFSARALRNIVTVDAGRLTATACAEDTSRSEVAVQLFTDPNGTSNAACGFVRPAE